MIVLGIETSGSVGSVAVCEDDDVRASHVFPAGPRHARNLLPAVGDVLQRAGLGRRRVDAVAVSEGPGSFTGLRIGVVCARTLSFALGWQCVGVPSLEVLVRNVATTAEVAAACPIRDARRDRVYGTLFRRENRDDWLDTTGVLLLPPQDLAARLPEGTIVFGSGVDACPDAFRRERFVLGPAAWGTGCAENVARLGRRRILTRGPDDPDTVRPRYHRLTEVEERLQADAG